MSYLATPEGRAVIAALCGKGDLAAALEGTLKMDQGFWMTAAADITALLCFDERGASDVARLLAAHFGNEILEALEYAPNYRRRRITRDEVDRLKSKVLGYTGESLKEVMKRTLHQKPEGDR